MTEHVRSVNAKQEQRQNDSSEFKLNLRHHDHHPSKSSENEGARQSASQGDVPLVVRKGVSASEPENHQNQPDACAANYVQQTPPGWVVHRKTVRACPQSKSGQKRNSERCQENEFYGKSAHR